LPISYSDNGLHHLLQPRALRKCSLKNEQRAEVAFGALRSDAGDRGVRLRTRNQGDSALHA